MGTGAGAGKRKKMKGQKDAKSAASDFKRVHAKPSRVLVTPLFLLSLQSSVAVDKRRAAARPCRLLERRSTRDRSELLEPARLPQDPHHASRAFSSCLQVFKEEKVNL